MSKPSGASSSPKTNAPRVEPPRMLDVHFHLPAELVARYDARSRHLSSQRGEPVSRARVMREVLASAAGAWRNAADATTATTTSNAPTSNARGRQ